MWIAQLVVNFTAGYTVSHDLNQLILKSYPTSVSNLLVATGRKNMEGETLLPTYLPLLLLTNSPTLSLQKLETVSLGFQGRLETRNNHVVPRNSGHQKHQKQVGISGTQPHVLSITGFLSLQCETAIVGLPRPCLLS